jgi:ADP-ribosylarginine hydrolase
MQGRAPGNQTKIAVEKYLKFDKMPNVYSTRAGGNGGAMRTMCIGLTFHSNIFLVAEIAVRATLATHPNFTAILGGCMSAVFTAYAVEQINPLYWMRLFLRNVVPYVYEVMRDSVSLTGVGEKTLDQEVGRFVGQCRQYLKIRLPRKSDGSLPSKPRIPVNWHTDFRIRDKFYSQFAFVNPSDGSSWNGSSGDDACIIAYDCILTARDPNVWTDVLYLAALHGGDSDSTASIAGAWFGAMHGMSAPTIVGLEFADELVALSILLHGVAATQTPLVLPNQEQ